MTIDFTRVPVIFAASLTALTLLAVALPRISVAGTTNYDGVDPEENPVPKRFRGTYVVKRELDAILSRRKPIRPLSYTTTFTEHEAVYGTRWDMVDGVAKHVGAVGTAQLVEISGPDGKRIVTFKARNRRGYFGEGEGVQIRLEDAAPPLARFNLQNVSMVALLARGYRTDAGEILWLEAVINWPPNAGEAPGGGNAGGGNTRAGGGRRRAPETRRSAALSGPRRRPVGPGAHPQREPARNR